MCYIGKALCVFALIGLYSCVPQENYDQLVENYDQLQSEFNQTKQRADTLEWYVNYILPELTLNASSQASEQILPMVISLNARYPYTAESQIELASPEQVVLPAMMTGNLFLLDDEVGLVPIESNAREMETNFEEIANAATGSEQFKFIKDPQKNELVMILDQDRLFRRSSANVRSDQDDFLRRLAIRLEGVTDYQIVIEGHTDDIEVLENASFQNTWELSAIRAARVAQKLVAYGVAPTKLTASAKGKYDYVFMNTREENRLYNRRIEIILVPQIEN